PGGYPHANAHPHPYPSAYSDPNAHADCYPRSDPHACPFPPRLLSEQLFGFQPGLSRRLGGQ
ncbi:MAG TPA: hypothetical protein VJ565_04770, partial [Dehalococcoidia bacterium]|nr:hypothetical protein [Dehalococcoidia bacterium]